MGLWMMAIRMCIFHLIACFTLCYKHIYSVRVLMYMKKNEYDDSSCVHCPIYRNVSTLTFRFILNRQPNLYTLQSDSFGSSTFLFLCYWWCYSSSPFICMFMIMSVCSWISFSFLKYIFIPMEKLGHEWRRHTFRQTTI